jgi:hypothetical protein
VILYYKKPGGIKPMTILFVLNRPGANNLKFLARFPNEELENIFKEFMREGKQKEAFDFVFSEAEPEQYLEPNKMYHIEAPEYILVEEFVVSRQKEASFV